MNSLSWIDIADMAGLTAPWLSEHREVFLSVPEIAPLLSRVEAAHQRVLGLCNAAEGAAAREQINASLQVADRRHDVCLRALWNGLTAASSWARLVSDGGGERASEIRLLRDRILPEGLRWVLRPYEVQIRNARRAMSTLGDRDRALLEEISLFEVSAMAVFEAWCETAENLGSLVQRRELLSWSGVSEEEVAVARQEWCQAMKLVLDLLSFAQVPTHKADLLAAPLRRAREEAELRRQAHEASEGLAAAG